MALIREIVLVAVIFVWWTDAAALLRPSDYHSRHESKISLTSLEQKRFISDHLPQRFHMNIKFGTKDINMQLSQKAHKRDVRLYRTRNGKLELTPNEGSANEWAVYQGEGNDEVAALIKRRDSDFSVEGSISHEGEHYMIQPDDESGHYLYHLKKSYKNEPLAVANPTPVLKRAVQEKYEVEVFMVFDHGIYRRLNQSVGLNMDVDEKIKELYGLLINDMDYRYKSLRETYNINIHIIMGGLTYYKTREEVPFGAVYPNKFEHVVHSRTLLDDFTAFVQKNLPGVDEVLLQSGFNFPGGNKGMAWYDGTCRERRVGVNLNDLDFRAGHINAHELGHNLGIRHDSKGDCLQNYVMYPFVSTLISSSYPLNSWQFSSCSADQLKIYLNLIKSENKNCLKTRSSEAALKYSMYGKKLYGQLLTYDQQCEMMIGQGSVHCPKSQLYYSLDKICYTIYCTSTDGRTCYKRYPYPGTQCGDQKLCNKGHCTYDRNAKRMNGKCPFGERKDLFIGNAKKCEEAIPESPNVCYRNDVRQGCCGLCKKYEGKNDACLFGDKPLKYSVIVMGKTYKDCKSLVNAYSGFCYIYSKECCKSCPPLARKDKPSCMYGDHIKLKGVFTRTYQLVCANVVKKHPGVCYEYSDHCCETCARIKNTNNPACMFGDKLGKQMYNMKGLWDTCYNSLSPRYSGLCYKYSKKCCGTCAKYKLPIKDCEYGDHIDTVYINDQRKQCFDITDEFKGLCYGYDKKCCKTCKKYQTGDLSCLYGDRYGKVVHQNGRKVSCKQGITKDSAYSCYKSSVIRDCCETCRKFRKNKDGCEFGDHKLEYPIKISRRSYYTCKEAVAAFPGVCYNHGRKCCESCAAVVNRKKPKCLYGDKYIKEGFTINRQNYDNCKEAHAEQRGMCYQHAEDCCETCVPGTNSKCPYGDAVTNGIYNYDTRRYETCKAAITDKTKGHCYEKSKEEKCCETCAKYKNPAVKECEYGDRLGNVVITYEFRRSCSQAITDDSTSGYCYRFKEKCCETCAKYKSDNKYCEYGDKPGNIIWVQNGYRKMKVSCKEAVRIKKSICNHRDYRKDCCKSCGGTFNIDK